MAPQYKLTYFDIRGLGEPIRFLLHYGKIQFEDKRIKFEDWPTFKQTLPGMGFLPHLEIDGKLVTQSGSICRFLAEELNLSGNDKWENLQIDIAYDTFNDWRVEVASIIKEQNPEAKETKKKRVAELTPKYLNTLEQQIKENDGYVANEKLSWADLYVVAVFRTELFILNDPDLLKPYPAIQGLIEKVENLPGIKEWVALRPKTDL